MRYRNFIHNGHVKGKANLYSFKVGDLEMQSNLYHRSLTLIELAALVICNICGIGLLSLPHSIASGTLFADGWVILFGSGFIVVILGWISTKLAAHFPKKSFYEYTSTLVSRPVAFLFSIIAICIYLCIAAYEIRSISVIVNLYLMENTDVKIIAFCFMLVLSYGLCGSRMALVQFCILGLYVVIVALIISFILNINNIDFTHLFPILKTPPMGYIRGLKNSGFAFLGFEVVLYYSFLVSNPKKAPVYVVSALLLIVMLYTITYLICICVFSQSVVQELVYPVVELGKEVEIGEFLERFDSFFFMTWIITIFSTTIIYLDMIVIVLTSVFKKTKKQTFVFFLMPIVYMISIFPNGQEEVNYFGNIATTANFFYILIIPPILLLITFVKKKKGQRRTN
ncbi:endospore germination permease [Bacillus cereus]|nr:endospore germination permease [Bacillus thuringiensis]EKS8360942.1 endospore germination permease [Bacillus cereus]PEW36927.1 spore gernimation protein GerLB [Bacillus cereus]PFF77415.1 spore gernimation protein GerLB [Bacillus cereus]PFQ32529.1 spore gernimation protein GerLB [Bacillus cereus]PFU19408.1 spore gernimation protein GerLB [Bacillus cereus]